MANRAAKYPDTTARGTDPERAAAGDTSHAASDSTPAGGRGGGDWLADKLQRSLARVEELTHELTRVQDALGSQRAELARVHETLAVLAGRTQRHESGQEATRAANQEVGTLAERIEQEAALRRDLAALVERDGQRDQEERDAARQRLDGIASQLEQVQQHLASDHERRQHTAADRSRRAREDQTSDARVAALERLASVAQEALRSAHEELARLGSALAGALAGIDELDERTRSAEAERRRLEEGLSNLEAQRDRKSELPDVIEQQHAVRQRMEERLAAFDEAMEESRRELAAASEERSMLRQQTAGNVERLRELAEALEEQRLAIVEHFRRWTEGGADSGRRQVEEIERANRVARDLLVRLTESSDEVGQERPL